MSSDENTKKIYRTLITCAVIIFLGVQRFMGVIIVIAAIPLSIWLLYSIYIIVSKPQLRKSQLTRIALWAASLLIIFGAHYYLYEVTRNNANDIVAMLEKYKSEHGSYPEKIDAIGLTQKQIKEKIGMAYYSFTDGQPHLFYGVTYVAFDTYDYNFQTKAWVYRAD